MRFRDSIPLLLLLIVYTISEEISEDKKLETQKMDVAKMPRDELETKYHLMMQEMERLQKDKNDSVKRAKIREISENLIRQAGHETNSILRAKELKIAADLFEHPFETEKKLLEEGRLKEKAHDLLEKAKLETNPQAQADMIKQAQDIIYSLKTGLKPEPSKKVTEENLQTWSPEKIQKFANEKIAEYMKLAKQARKDGKAAKAEKLLNEVGELMRDPKEALTQHRKKEKNRDIAKETISKLIDKAKKTKSDIRRKEYLNMAKELETHPNIGIKKFKKNKLSKMVKKAEKMAKKLLEQAKTDENPISQTIKIKTARALLEHPIKALREMKVRQEQDDLIKGSPPVCHPFLLEAFKKDLGLTIDDIKIGDLVNYSISKGTKKYTKKKKAKETEANSESKGAENGSKGKSTGSNNVPKNIESESNKKPPQDTTTTEVITTETVTYEEVPGPAPSSSSGQESASLQSTSNKSSSEKGKLDNLNSSKDHNEDFKQQSVGDSKSLPKKEENLEANRKQELKQLAQERFEIANKNTRVASSTHSDPQEISSNVSSGSGSPQRVKAIDLTDEALKQFIRQHHIEPEKSRDFINRFKDHVEKQRLDERKVEEEEDNKPHSIIREELPKSPEEIVMKKIPSLKIDDKHNKVIQNTNSSSQNILDSHKAHERKSESLSSDSLKEERHSSSELSSPNLRNSGKVINSSDSSINSEPEPSKKDSSVKHADSISSDSQATSTSAKDPPKSSARIQRGRVSNPSSAPSRKSSQSATLSSESRENIKKSGLPNSSGSRVDSGASSSSVAESSSSNGAVPGFKEINRN